MGSRVGPTIAVVAVLAGLTVVVVGLISSRHPPAVEEPIGTQLPEPDEPSSDQAVAELRDLTIEGAEVTRKDADGNVLWRLSAAGEFDFGRDTQTLRAADVRWELMRPGEEKLIVEAPEFLASYPERTLTFSQGVQAYTADRSQLFEMPELVYQIDTEKLVAAGRVRFRYGRHQATASRLVIDNRTEQVRMSGGVRFTRLPSK